MEHIKITYSNGRGKYGQQYAYIRPAMECFNRSRRVLAEKLQGEIARHFPGNKVNYYKVGDYCIGAKDEKAAIKEYWRVCNRGDIGRNIDVEFSHSG